MLYAPADETQQQFRLMISKQNKRTLKIVGEPKRNRMYSDWNVYGHNII